MLSDSQPQTRTNTPLRLHAMESLRAPLPSVYGINSFVGREDELAFACNELRKSDVRLLTITGPAGVGKTRLAFQIGQHLEREFANGVHFVLLANHPFGITGVSQQDKVHPIGKFTFQVLRYLKRKSRFAHTGRTGNSEQADI